MAADLFHDLLAVHAAIEGDCPRVETINRRFVPEGTGNFFPSLSLFCFSITIVEKLWIPMRKIDDNRYSGKGRPVPSRVFLRSRIACLFIMQAEVIFASTLRRTRHISSDQGTRSSYSEDVGSQVFPAREKHL